jgi:hypothetical protein
MRTWATYIYIIVDRLLRTARKGSAVSVTRPATMDYLNSIVKVEHRFLDLADLHSLLDDYGSM